MYKQLIFQCTEASLVVFNAKGASVENMTSPTEYKLLWNLLVKASKTPNLDSFLYIGFFQQYINIILLIVCIHECMNGGYTLKLKRGDAVTVAHLQYHMST